MRGWGAPTPCTVKNLYITSDIPKTWTTNSLLLTGSLNNHKHSVNTYSRRQSMSWLRASDLTTFFMWNALSWLSGLSFRSQMRCPLFKAGFLNLSLRPPEHHLFISFVGLATICLHLSRPPCCCLSPTSPRGETFPLMERTCLSCFMSRRVTGT